jgi:hypothetical protein
MAVRIRTHSGRKRGLWRKRSVSAALLKNSFRYARVPSFSLDDATRLRHPTQTSPFWKRLAGISKHCADTPRMTVLCQTRYHHETVDDRAVARPSCPRVACRYADPGTGADRDVGFSRPRSNFHVAVASPGHARGGRLHRAVYSRTFAFGIQVRRRKWACQCERLAAPHGIDVAAMSAPLAGCLLSQTQQPALRPDGSVTPYIGGTGSMRRRSGLLHRLCMRCAGIGSLRLPRIQRT